MSKAMQALKDFLSVSPSVVFPDEVLELLEPMEREDAKLRERADTLEWLLKLTLKYAEEGEIDCCELCERIGTCENHPAHTCTHVMDTPSDFIRKCMRELEIEVES